MDSTIKTILNAQMKKERKLYALNELSKDIEFAKDVISGKYKYCKECDDYYLAHSFIVESRYKNSKILTYADPINSGGNEYRNALMYTVTETCPKGHVVNIYEEEANDFYE
jgi:hypothetical protein